MSEERVFALNTLAAIALQEGAPEIIANTDLIRSVVPLLTDENIHVRLTAVGALRLVYFCWI